MTKYYDTNMPVNMIWNELNCVNRTRTSHTELLTTIKPARTGDNKVCNNLAFFCICLDGFINSLAPGDLVNYIKKIILNAAEPSWLNQQ